MINNYDDLIDSFNSVKDEHYYPADDWLTEHIENPPKTAMGQEGLDFKNAAKIIAEMAYKFGQEDSDYKNWIVFDYKGNKLRIGDKIIFNISGVNGWEEHRPQIYTISGFDFRDGQCEYINVVTDRGSEALNWRYCSAFIDSWDQWTDDLEMQLLDAVGEWQYDELENIINEFKERAQLLNVKMD